MLVFYRQNLTIDSLLKKVYIPQRNIIAINVNTHII